MLAKVGMAAGAEVEALVLSVMLDDGWPAAAFTVAGEWWWLPVSAAACIVGCLVEVGGGGM